MPERTNPYVDLPASAYWKAAVAEAAPDRIGPLWKPKFALGREARILAAGSCFAQHISKALRGDGFHWLEPEEAPANLAQEARTAHGYGTFSFRTGNIYTARLLRQWIEWAIGGIPMPEEAFVEESRYFDPYRPTIPPDGHASIEELHAARRATLAAISQGVREADLLIFTLGLTEAWMNRSGTVYPMCPGTIRGAYDAQSHVFHNFSEHEVAEDLALTFDLVRRVNPRMRFLLTVSPVPLVATASGQHVMVATTHSKSVLRAAAGRLADAREDVDYFPSYEIISSPAFKGRFFEKNLRSVTQEGVAFVMGHFFAALEGSSAADARTPAAPIAAEAAADSPRSPTDEICEEIVLEAWSRRRIDAAEAPPNLMLLGDSQMAMIADVLEAQHIAFAGGAIMQASGWHYQRFELRGDERFFAPTASDAAERWNETWQRCLAHREANPDLTVITNVGSHTCVTMVDGDFDKYLRIFYEVTERMTIPSMLIRSYFLNVRLPHLMLLRKLIDAGFKVVWVTDPPTQERLQELYAAFDQALEGLFASIGCQVFSARTWATRGGTQPVPQEFFSTEIDTVINRPDWMHGSPEYYRQLMAEIFRVHNIRPQVRAPQAAAAAE